MFPDSRLHLLEKRLKTSPRVANEKNFTLLTVVNEVHNFANELWKDAQIFGPHQDASRLSPTKSDRKSNTSSSHSNKRTSRSGELFSDLDDDKRARLEKLANLYSQSLDNNMSVSIFSEVELWFQLLAENYDSSLSTFAPKDQIFSTVASRVYFVTKVIELQLTNILFYIDSGVLQAILKNYPHRVPKHLRKQLEKIVLIQQENRKKSDLDQASYSHQFSDSHSESSQHNKDERVTFQSETDGRANFLNQSDFHAFCKQRDIFYAIKDAWTKSRTQKQQFTPFSNAPSNAFQQQQQQHFNVTQNNHNAGGNFSSHHNSNTNYHSRRIQLKPPSSLNPSSNNNSNLDAGSSTTLQKMKQLIQLNSSPTNLSHLATLCLSQFILDYVNNKKIGGLDTEDENFRQFFQSNPSKFKQLENRFPNPSRFNNEPLTFLKYFIDLANWAEFNQHLIDRCIFEINQIDSSIDRQEVRNSKDLLENLNKSRILAQVLGFLFFRPYRQSQANSQNDGNSRFGKALHSIETETYLRKQIKLRSYHRPPVDLVEKIFEAIQHKKLMFTLPWIVDFLSQADAVTFLLPAYKKVISICVQVYRKLLVVDVNNSFTTTPTNATAAKKSTINEAAATESDSLSIKMKNSGPLVLSRTNVAFLRFYCGKLFKTQDFPTAMIFLNSNNSGNNVSESVEDITFEKLIDKLKSEAAIQAAKMETTDNNIELDSEDDILVDSYDSIGDALISLVFEKQMSEFKSILDVNPKSNVNQNNATVNILPVKHINDRPSSTVATTVSKKIVPTIPIIDCKPPTNGQDLENDTSSLQIKLESCFFQNHPPSVKRTVDFISDRIVSNFVKTVTGKLYPDFRTECLVKGISGAEAVSACQDKILKEFKICLPKSEQAIDLLVGNCVSEGALVACKGICSRRCLNRINEWVNSHINKDLFPSIPLPKITSPSSSSSPVPSPTSPNVNPSPSRQHQPPETTLQPKFQAIVKLQQSLQKIYKTKSVVTINMMEFLSVLKKDQLGTSSLIVSTTLDVVLSILTFCPQDFTQQVENAFVLFWSEPQVWNSRMTMKVLCPRNIVLFEQSNNPDVTWKRLSNLVCRLLKYDLMRLPELEQQCLEFIRHDWPPTVLKRVSEFSKQISGVNAPTRTEESEVIDWIAWACSDDADF